MSNPEKPQKGGIDRAKIVTLDQFVAEAKRYQGWNARTGSDWGIQYALVNGDDEVIAAIETLPEARIEFVLRMDDDALAALDLRRIREIALLLLSLPPDPGQATVV